MKVTVTFGNVRVIVPCGNGDLSVRDLMELAVTRYKKATGKPSNNWVTIHNLKISKDEGILYPDDRLTDVADDREQITAIFEEQYFPIHNGGDGTSASSIGTDSPDIFHNKQDSHSPQHDYNDVKITNDYIPNGIIPLHVRRGSEPILNSTYGNCTNLDKRWSTAVIVNNGHSKHSNLSQEESSDDSDIPNEREAGNGKEASLKSYFSQNPLRLSDDCHKSNIYHWQDKCERQERKEPLGGSGSSSERLTPERDDSDSDDEKEMMITLKKDVGPLGIHVIPNYDVNGRDRGLIIRNIEQGGRIYHDGRISVGDCIVEINGYRLSRVSFQKAQEIFKDALDANEIKLSLMKGLPTFSSRVSKKHSPLIYPKPSSKAAISNEDWKIKDDFTTPNKSRIHSVNTLTSNTRKIGKKIHIQLKKGCYGLGFSVTTRDNPAGKNCPIYIKNILPKGTAIEDGKLKPGDRLLEVNGIEMTGKHQDEVVTILRSISQGEIVNLLLSRQISDPSSPSPSLPRELPPDKAGDEQSDLSGKHREILTFEIPLNDTGSAGLGVSVKGKTSAVHDYPIDLGIFVKSVIHGGAASKDGRLRSNDQLISINGTSLLRMTNIQAMETLRHAMTHCDGPNPDAIVLTVARRISQYEHSDSPYSNCHQRSDSLVSGSGESDGSATILGGNFGSCVTQSNLLSETKKQISSTSFDKQELPSRKFSLPSRHPIIDYLIGQTPKSDFNLSTNFSDESLIVSSSLTNTPIRKIERTNFKELSKQDKQMDTSVPEQLLLSNNKYKSDVQTPNSNKKSEKIYESQQSLNEEETEFYRDGFGRQSMSEKRHAHIDAKNTDIYQRNKKVKEKHDEKRKQVIKDSLSVTDEQIRKKWQSDYSHNLGPSLGMRKSSSLESLQTVLQELQKDESASCARSKYTATVARERNCNNSFRAAIDKSYEGVEIFEDDDKQTQEDKKSKFINSLNSSTDSAHDILHIHRNKIHNSTKKKFLKGIGSMFCRFGKHRKSDSLKKCQDKWKQETEMLKAKWMAQDEHERIQEHYKRFVEQQKQEQEHVEHIRSRKMSVPVLPSVESTYLSSPHHRQRLQFMQSSYQYDDVDYDDWNEQETKEILVRQPSLPLFSIRNRYQTGWQHQSPEIHRSRSQPPQIRRTQSLRYAGRQKNHANSQLQSSKIDVYKEMERAGSRAGISDPKIYEHYMSYSIPCSRSVSPTKNISSLSNLSNSPLNNSRHRDYATESLHQNIHKSMGECENRSPSNIKAIYKKEKHSNKEISHRNTSRLKNDSSDSVHSNFINNSDENSKRQRRVTGSKV